MLVMNSLMKVLTLGALLATFSALAEPDRFHLGTGRDGALVVSGSDTVVNRHALVRAPIAPGDTAILVEQSEGFAAGDLVMVLQTTGIVPTATPGDVAPVDLSRDAVGRWELARLVSVDGEFLYLSDRLLHSYAAEVSQVVRVPEFTTVDIRTGARIVAQPWNGATGGIIAFLATGTVTNEGAIDASGSGFRGGSYVRQVLSRQCTSPSAWMERGARRGEGVDSTNPGGGSGRANIANGGGGGACMPSGGGGGGHGGPGGQGGQPAEGPRDVGGMGGARLVYSLLDRLTLGGGGGGGSGWNAQYAPNSNGGQGGGAIFIRAEALVGNGRVVARGEPGHGSEKEGAGGGGAGGSISLRVAGALQCASLDASGGHGGNNGATGALAAGGGGGGGQVLYQAAWVSECVMSAAASLAGSGRAPSGAQPDSTTLFAHAGTVTQLDGGLIRPGAATILHPEYGALVRTRTPTISGTAPVGLEVVIFLDGLEVGRTVAEGGFFEWRMNQPLSEGLHHVQAAASYQGLQGELSPFQLLVVSLPQSPLIEGSTAIPAVSAPTFDKIATRSYSSGMLINDASPLIEGAAAACDSVTVEIRNSGGSLVALLVDLCSSNRWDVTPGFDLDNGTYTLIAKAIKGLEESPTASGSFRVDAEAPPAPVIQVPANGGYVNDLSPVISGTAEPSSTIKVYIDGASTPMSTSPSTVTTSAGGAWSLSPGSSRSVGFHWIRVEATDAAGNTSPLSDVSTFTIDNVAPSIPVVTSPANNAVTNDTPEIRGTAEAGSTIIVIDGATELTPTVVADSSGNWVFVASTRWSQGAHSFKVKARDRAGNMGSESSARNLTIDVAPPETTISPAVAAFIKTASLTISFTSEAGATFKCSTDGVNFTNCTTASSHTINSMVHGSTYRFYVRASDAVGNVDPTPASASWEVDTQVTSPTFTSPDNNAYTNDTTPELQGTAEAGSTVTVYDSGVALTPTVVADAAGKWVFVPSSPLTAATHTLTATARDRALNDSTPSAPRTLTIDTTVPDTVLTGMPPNPDYSADARFTFAAGPGAGTVNFECSLDGAEFSSCSSEHAIADLVFGTHTFRVRAVDLALNSDPTPASYTWLYDNRPTETRIDSKPDAFSNAASVTILFSSNKSVATFECQYYKVGTTPPGPTDCASPFPISGLTTGRYRFEVNATDGSGNRDAAGASAEWEIDRTAPPMPTISSPLAGALLASNSFSVSGKAEVGAIVTVSIDGISKGEVVVTDPSGNWSVPVSAVSEGVRTVRAMARDLAGNISTPPTENSRQVTVDTTPPITVLDSPRPPLYSPVATAQIHFSASLDTSESAVTYECRLDTGLEEACSSPWTVPAAGTLSEGPHTVFVRATDAAGNRDLTPAEYTWEVDTVKPQTFVDLKPPERTGARTVYFSFRSSETPMTFKCELDGVLVSGGCLSSHSVTITPVSPDVPETHSLKVWAYDRAGNEDPVAETITWTLDENLPGVAIVTAPPDPTKNAQAVFEFTSTKSGALYECLLDPVGEPTTISSWLGCTTPFSFFVSDGPHVLWVRARDTLGNVTSPDEYKSATWTVDTQRPDTVIETDTAAWTQETTATFKFSAKDETDVSFECTLNGASLACLTTPFTTPPLPDGTHTLSVKARDAAGNEDAVAATFTWTVDTVDPAAPVVTAPAADSILTNNRLTFEGTVEPLARVVLVQGSRELGSTVASETGAWRLELAETFRDGSYDFALTAYDRALNSSEVPTALSLAIDATAPESLILEGPDERQRIRAREVSFRIGANEPANLECSVDGNEPFDCGDEPFNCGGEGQPPAACGVVLNLKDLKEGDHDLFITAKDKAGNREISAEVRRWRVYLGGDSKAMGGGLALNCAAGGAGASSLLPLGLALMSTLLRRKRRAVTTNPNKCVDKELV
ncbi:Ig-like domain-containing protein [Archangium sp. Cb G35]|uniref:adventurous gliding motility protein AgmC n=1 Tax=Archangium sp. Cb G35 TaxID=1920190 RepID=UPI000AC50D7A|nr:Ig-like domain-containing protein [Archangium sp. Cb G35]